MKATVLLCLFFQVLLLRAQEQPMNNLGRLNGNSKLKIDAFSYPTFLNNEMHSSFLINSKLSKDLELQLQGFYDTYLYSNTFEASLTFRLNLTKNYIYFLGWKCTWRSIKGLQSREP